VSSPEPVPDLIPLDGEQRHIVVRVILVGAAVVCFALGVLFGFVPGIPGFAFHIVGLLLLGAASRRVAVWVNRREARLSTRHRLWLRRFLRREVTGTS
jgi:UPF0716 family protein affecting phage T7 exclusion